MAANADNVLVGSGGTIFVAPVGTTMPTNIDTALNAAFEEVGFISEDGITVSAGVETAEINAFQSFYAIRRLVTGRSLDLGFALREWREVNLLLAFGGGEVTEAAGVYTYTPPAAGDALFERAMVVEWRDGDKDYRLCVPRGVVTEAVETNITRSAAADLPVTFSVLTDDSETAAWSLISNDPGLEPAGS